MVYQIDRTKCLCCHNCALECPKRAISYKGTGYSVDESLCIGCGKCARVCNVAAAKAVGEEPTAPAHELEEISADIVVLGAGASGIVAAARAAQLSGKKVVLLEKAAKFGGSGWFAGFMVPAEGEKPMQPPMFAQAQQALKEGGVDPEIMELAQQVPTAFFQWLRSMDSRVDEYWAPLRGPFGGVSMELKQRTLFNLKNKDKAIGPGRSTSVMEQILVDHFPELGVELRTSHQAVAIEKDTEGKICGVLANNPGGQVHISCRAVISCTGGFAHNDEMLRQYAPQFFGEEGSEPTHRFAAPTNTGDVVKLGEGVGAYLDRENFFANVFGPVHHPFSFCLFSFGIQPEVVNVNLKGQRFVDESAFGAGAAYIVKQPGRVAWSIIDADTKELLGQRLANSPDGELLKDYEMEFEEELSLDTPLKKADTLEELAQLCGVEADGLIQTISRYNEFCAQGKDEEFHKRPDTLRPVAKAPFYAIYGKVATDGAFGGMLINSHMEVFRADKSGAIPGLYAAGDNSSGWALKSKEEGDHRLMVTNECNWAIASGFVAGAQAAAYCTE
jgi:succinate dehydrogenase/fumarate reductase flavoprotein subunit